MQIPVSAFIVRYLEGCGVRSIFGMPGAHILPVYDALYDSSIQAVLAKHEQGAAFMAGGNARTSGGIGACITTAGPGATNLVTGIANAYADKQPILVITGEAPTRVFGKGGLQESSGEGGAIDQGSLFRGISRYHKLVERTDYLPQVLNRTSSILRSDNPGPVVLSFPYDVQKELIDEELLEHAFPRGQCRTHRCNPELVSELAQLLLRAERPAVIAGYGVIRANAQGLVTELAERLGMAVTTSLKGKGAIDERSPLSLGPLGVTAGGIARDYIRDQADLLLFLGASFNERTSYLWDARLLEDKTIVQVDTDPEQLEKVFHADLAIPGDIQSILAGLLDELPENLPQRITRRRLDFRSLQSIEDNRLYQSGFSLVARFFEQLAERLPAGVRIFDDNILFAQNFYTVSAENRFHPNSGVSSLGHAIPAAIGSRFAEAAITFAIVGDGGFQMSGMELMTAVNYNIPINVVVFNNGTMGLIRKNQHQQYRDRFINCDFINPNLDLLAQSFGIHYHRIDREADIGRMFEEMDLANQINLIEIPIDKDLFPNYSSRR